MKTDNVKKKALTFRVLNKAHADSEALARPRNAKLEEADVLRHL